MWLLEKAEFNLITEVHVNSTTTTTQQTFSERCADEDVDAAVVVFVLQRANCQFQRLWRLLPELEWVNTDKWWMVWSSCPVRNKANCFWIRLTQEEKNIPQIKTFTVSFSSGIKTQTPCCFFMASYYIIYILYNRKYSYGWLTFY